jgi:hypothetical protein
MNRSIKIFLVIAALILGATVQAQTTAQADTQTNGQASVQADKNAAQISGAASASSSASAPSSQNNAGVASGTAFNAMLDKPVDAKKSKPGDPITAHTTESSNNLPKGTKLVGHVTQASARAKGDSESELGIQFDRAILKNGQQVPLNAAIQAMAAPHTTESAADGDLDSMSNVGAGAVGSGMVGGRGAAGGLTSATGGTVGSVSHTAAGGGVIRQPLNSSASPVTHVTGASHGAVGGLNTAGNLTSNSRGVFTMNGLNLNSAASNGAQGSVITSAGKNVHLDSGTRLLMVTQSTASATPNP